MKDESSTILAVIFQCIGQITIQSNKQEQGKYESNTILAVKFQCLGSFQQNKMVHKEEIMQNQDNLKVNVATMK